MGMYLNMTGIPILYSCEWPLYDYQHGQMVQMYSSLKFFCIKFFIEIKNG